MQVRQEVIGVLQVLDPEPNRFTDLHQVLQELLAAIVSIAIDNARLQEQVHQDARTKHILLSDLNRRIDTMLSSTIRLFSTVRRHAGLRKQTESKALMSNMLVRIKGLKRVYAFLAEFEWNPLPLSELIHRVIQGTLDALVSHKNISVDISSSPVRVTPEQADSLGMIINELVTNTVKHATIGRDSAHITVHLAKIGDTIHVEYRDDGPGWPEDAARFDRHYVGVYLLQKCVRKDLDGKIDMYTDKGAVTEIRFKAAVQTLV
jgi:two-component sensor histidine kinase